MKLGIPVFAVVISDKALNSRFKSLGLDSNVVDLENYSKYAEFKKVVLSKMCNFFDDTKDIKLAIHKTLNDFQQRYKFTGWVSGKEISEMSIQFVKAVETLSQYNFREILSELAITTKVSDDIKDIDTMPIDKSELPKALSKDEEKHYLNLLKQGDENAKRILIHRNLRTVVWIVRKLRNDSIPDDDLISIGILGLIKGVYSYNQYSDIEFTQHIAQCIQTEMKKYIDGEHWGVDV